MRTTILTLATAALLVCAPAAHATEADPVTDIVDVRLAEPPAAGELRLTEVQLRSEALSDDAMAAQPSRGSFWWYVGVIVVAGVILAVVL